MPTSDLPSLAEAPPALVLARMIESAAESWRAGGLALGEYWHQAVARGAGPLDVMADAARWWSTATRRERPRWHSANEVVLTSPVARGAAVALSGWTKFAPLLVAPLWASYPVRQPRRTLAFSAAFLAATLVAFSILLLEPNRAHAARVIWDRTLGWQIGRDSPFSLWDWRQYHAGLPDLHVVQWVLEGLLVVGAIAAYFLPRRKSPLQLAALTAALLIGFELVLTHWFYLYLPWFFPFAVIALLLPTASPTPVGAPAPDDREARELVVAR